MASSAFALKADLPPPVDTWEMERSEILAIRLTFSGLGPAFHPEELSTGCRDTPGSLAQSSGENGS